MRRTHEQPDRAYNPPPNLLSEGKEAVRLFRQAFTLVEMLVVAVIIVILAGLTLVVMNSAMHSAKVAKTRSTIQKLDTVMLQIFERYEEEYYRIKNRVNTLPAYSTLTPDQQDTVVTHFIRDLMRMEMPHHWEDVYDSATGTRLSSLPVSIQGQQGEYRIPCSPLLAFYFAESQRAAAGKTPGRAALLFLIVQNHLPEALEAFHGSEVADTDGDGLLEFVDAWGKPIQFLRWAPAFPGSDIQQDILKMADYTPSGSIADRRTWWFTGRATPDTTLHAAALKAMRNHSDPTDERAGAVGWFWFPVVFSAGPDGKYGLDMGEEDEEGNVPSPVVGNEGILSPFDFPFGMPTGSEHLDNIHNHMWYRSF